ncbi:dihydrolipoyl dehydrogenase [Phocaeicola sp.]
MKYQIAIIGGGPAGYTAAEAAGKAGLSVVLFEKRSLGGVCLNEGCIPTKTLLYSAKVYDYAKHASKYAVTVPEASFDAAKIVARKSKVVRKLVLGIKAKLTAHHVNIVTGEATIIDKNTIKCGEETYECENLLLCTGSETFIPPIPGVDTVDYWTHRDALDCKELPASLTIVGGGVIGMEFASYFNSMGVKVTVVEMMDEILGGMDKELSALLRAEYAKRGIQFMLSTKVTQIENQMGCITLYCEPAESGTMTIQAEKLLMSVGRRPVTKGFGLENLNLEVTERRCIKVDEHLQSSVPGVYVCGDLNGVSLLAHTAVREAEVAVHHIVGKEDAMSYRAIPGVVYTNPEIAGVGMSEEALKAAGIPYNTVKLPMAYSGRFVAENEGVNGVCKVLTAEDGTILGAHMLGNPASELIVMAGMAIEDRKTVEDWKRYVFPHPTVGEIFREL